MQTTNRNRNYLADFVLLMASLVWGSTFFLVKNALDFIAPFYFMTLRFGLALFVITVIVAPQIRRLSSLELMGGVLTGLSLFMGFTFQTWGLVYTTAGKSAFITGLNVILVPFILLTLGHQRIRPKGWWAAGLATLGLLLLTNPTTADNLNRGDGLTILCAIAFAVQIILLGIYAPKANTLRYFWVQMATISLLSAGATSMTDSWQLALSPELIRALLITGFAGTTLAFLGMTWAQRYAPPTRVALILASEPVFGAVFAVMVAGEYLALIGWLGGALIVGAIIWAETGNRKNGSRAAEDPARSHSVAP